MDIKDYYYYYFTRQKSGQLIAEYMQSRFERRPEGPRPGMAQDPISGILLQTDENIGSRMKTCLSIIDSYDEIMDFIFPPNLSFFMMNFELVLGTCFFHS